MGLCGSACQIAEKTSGSSVNDAPVPKNPLYDQIGRDLTALSPLLNPFMMNETLIGPCSEIEYAVQSISTPLSSATSNVSRQYFPKYYFYHKIVTSPRPEWMPCVYGLHHHLTQAYLFQSSNWSKLVDAKESIPTHDLALQLTLAVFEMHYRYDMVHLNITPSSIGIDPDGKVKMIDLSSVACMDDIMTIRRHIYRLPICYQPPEVALNRVSVCGRHIDAWLIGVVLFEHATKEPFWSMRYKDDMLDDYIRMMSFLAPRDEEHGTWHDRMVQHDVCRVNKRLQDCHVDPKLRRIISLLLSFNPRNRATPYQAWAILNYLLTH